MPAVVISQRFLVSAASRRRAGAALHALTALVLAFTYFSFRVELFSDEAEKQFHDLPHGRVITTPSLTWESYDKDNAPAAYTVEVFTEFACLVAIPPIPAFARQDILPYQPVRDKSPPTLVFQL